MHCFLRAGGRGGPGLRTPTEVARRTARARARAPRACKEKSSIPHATSNRRWLATKRNDYWSSSLAAHGCTSDEPAPSGARRILCARTMPVVAKIFDPPPFTGILPSRIEDVEHLPRKKMSGCRTYAGARQCGMEWDEWMMIDALVKPDDVVIEYGARFGTTSCRLALATKNSGRVASIDPDKNVLKYLLANRASHNCRFYVVAGTVSDVSLAMPRITHYGTASHVARANESNTAGNLALAEVERRMSAKLTVALIDCEGCMAHAVNAPGDLLGRVSTVLIEEDHAASSPTGSGPYGKQGQRDGEVDYRYWHRILRERGFENVWHAQDTFDPNATWSRTMRHSAWRRRVPGEAPLVDECGPHKARTGLKRTELECLPLLRTN